MICGCLITTVKKSENGGCKHEGPYHTAGLALSRVNVKKHLIFELSIVLKRVGISKVTVHQSSLQSEMILAHIS